MSTRIHNGYYRTGDDFAGFMAWLRHLAAEMRELKRERVAQIIARAATLEFDRRTLGPPIVYKTTCLLDALNAAYADYRATAAKGLRGSPYDYSCSVSFTPDNVSRRVMLLLFTERPAMRELFESQRFVNEYAYWDNTDPPEGMDKYDWAERRKAWETAIAGGPPSRSMATFEFTDAIPNYDLPTPGEHPVPPFEDRVAACARDAIFNAAVRDPAHTGSDLGASARVTTLMASVSKYTETPEGAKRLEAFGKDIASKLKQKLDPGDLTRELDFRSKP